MKVAIYVKVKDSLSVVAGPTSIVTIQQLPTIISAMKRKQIKPVIVKAPKRRNIVALHAKMRKAGPMADTSWHAFCTECGDSGVIYNGKHLVPCHECQANDDFKDI